MAAAAILNLFESKIAPLEIRRPRKPHPITKHEVDNFEWPYLRNGSERASRGHLCDSTAFLCLLFLLKVK